MIFLNFDAFWGTVTLTFDLEVIQSFQTWRSLTSIRDPEMEATTRTVSEKAQRKKRLRTDRQTRDTRSEIDMMKILAIKEKKEKNSYQIIQLDLLYNQYCKVVRHIYSRDVRKCLEK